MSEEKRELVDTSSIDKNISDLAQQVMAETDPDKAKQLIGLFNWNISKKQTSRILKLNELYDDVTDHMVTRFKTKSDQFSNSDVLDYMKAVQGAIDTSTKNLTQIEDPPTIVQNNTQINVNVVDGFDRDAKIRIFEAIQATLKNAEQCASIPEEEVVEVDAKEISSDSKVDDAIAELDAIVEETKETNN